MNQLEKLIAEFRELDRVTPRPLSHEDYAIAAISFFQLKEAELVEENQRLKSQLKYYCNDCQHPSVNEQQAAELSKLRQENEAKRSDLTDKLEEAVHHMDNGHTAQATTLIYEVIGELEPKGE